MKHQEGIQSRQKGLVLAVAGEVGSMLYRAVRIYQVHRLIGQFREDEK